MRNTLARTRDALLFACRLQLLEWTWWVVRGGRQVACVRLGCRVVALAAAQHIGQDRGTRVIRVMTLLICALLLAGCAAKPAAAPSAEPVPYLVSSDVTATAESLYGARLLRLGHSSFDGPGDSPDARMAQVNVELASGEMSGAEPFQLMAALARREPGMRRYLVTYAMGSRLESWAWIPAQGTVEHSTGETSGSLGTLFPRGAASGMTTAAIEAIAAGDRELPDFK